jgi:hypothetical protein
MEVQMLKFAVGIAIGVGMMTYAPNVVSFPKVLASINNMMSDSQVLDRWVQNEQRRIRWIRDEYGEWKAAEVCRKSLAEFERFARDRGISAPSFVCG